MKREVDNISQFYFSILIKRNRLSQVKRGIQLYAIHG